MSYKITEVTGDVSKTYEGDDVEGVVELYMAVSEATQPCTQIINNSITYQIPAEKYRPDGTAWALDC